MVFKLYKYLEIFTQKIIKANNYTQNKCENCKILLLNIFSNIEKTLLPNKVIVNSQLISMDNYNINILNGEQHTVDLKQNKKKIIDSNNVNNITSDVLNHMLNKTNLCDSSYKVNPDDNETSVQDSNKANTKSGFCPNDNRDSQLRVCGDQRNSKVLDSCSDKNYIGEVFQNYESIDVQSINYDESKCTCTVASDKNNSRTSKDIGIVPDESVCEKNHMESRNSFNVSEVFRKTSDGKYVENSSVTTVSNVDVVVELKKTNEIEILYEDDDYIVVNKPYDLVINSNDVNNINTLDRLLMNQKGMSLDQTDKKKLQGFYYVHRLDYATSGAICLAKDRQAASLAGKLMQDRKVSKMYLAIVRGHVMENITQIDFPIGYDDRYLDDNKMMCAAGPHCIKPKNSTTRMVLLETGFIASCPVSKVLLKPVTGRRHQLRLHCHLIGHTIVGDYTYSARMDCNNYRMFLHSYRLKIPLAGSDIDVISLPDFQLKDWTLYQEHNKLSDIPLSF